MYFSKIEVDSYVVVSKLALYPKYWDIYFK